jgi:hypothetical protein
MPSCYSRIELIMKKRSSTTKGLLLGVFFFAKGPQDIDHRQSDTKDFLLFMPKLLKTKITSESSDGERRSCHQVEDENTILSLAI